MSFDAGATAKQLETVTRKLYEDGGEDHICDLKDVGEKIDEITLESADKRGSTMLCVPDKEDGHATELVVRAVGVLVGQDLPPRRRPIPARERAYARQHVMLSSLGATCFTEGIEELSALTQQFARFFEPGEWAGWSPPKTDDGFLALDANCRYLSPVQYLLRGGDIPFCSTEDPQHHLERSKDANYIRTENNVVEFYKRSTTGDQYEEFDPRGFCNGDIVAAHVGFLMVKVRPGNYQRKGPKEVERFQMLVILRGLTLIARNEHQQQHIRCLTSTSISPDTARHRKWIHNTKASEGMEGVEGGVTSSFKHLKV